MKSLLKIFAILIIILIFIYAFSSSFASQNIENLAYVLAIGIDKNTDNSDKLNVSFQFMQMSALGDASSGEQPNVIVNSVTGNSINNAIYQMNTYIGKELNLAHCSLIVFSSDLAKEGIATEIYSLINNETLRPSTYLLVSDSPANKYLENVKPNLEKVVTKYYDTFPLTSAFTGYTQNVSIGTFYNRMLSECWGNTIPIGNVFQTKSSQESSSNSQSSSSSSNQSSSSSSSNSTPTSGSSNSSSTNTQTSGNINSSQSNNQASSSDDSSVSKLTVSGQRGTQNTGSSVFKNDKMVGELSGLETMCHLLIINDIESCIISVPNTNTDTDMIDLSLSPIKTPSISVDISGNNPKITIDLFLEANILTIDTPNEFNNSYDLEKISSKAEKYLNDKIYSYLNKVSKEYKSDIDGFARFAIKKFLTQSDWSSYNWQSKYENADFVVNSTVNVTSSLLLTEIN